jgi:thioredoxin reductase (NADPH)
MSEIRNVVIIGSGPSGYTAALYTARAGLHPLLIAGSFDPATSRMKGGQLMQTSDIENFPAAIEWPVQDATHVRGISGPELMQRMEMQAVASGAELLEEFVTEVDLCQNPGRLYTVKTASGKEIQTRAIIISTGASAKKLGIAAEDQFFGQGGGVSTCATCDGAQFARAGATVAVIGGGDSAMEEASYLARLDGIPKVYVIHRRDEFRASKVMLKRVQENPKIEMILHAAVEDLKGKPHPLAETQPYFKGKELLAAAVLKDTRTGETRELPIDGLFVAIGHTPNTELFANQLKMDEAGYLEHDKHLRAIPSLLCSSAEMRALEHVPGVFVSGDVADHVYRQAITAAGMGCQAAIEAERYLAEVMASDAGLTPGDIDISTESVAQSHWGAEREAEPLIARVEEAVESATA